MLVKVGLGSTTQWKLESQGLFPARRKITPGGLCAWDEDEVDEWIRTRPMAKLCIVKPVAEGIKRGRKPGSGRKPKNIGGAE